MKPKIVMFDGEKIGKTHIVVTAGDLLEIDGDKYVVDATRIEDGVTYYDVSEPHPQRELGER